jgi:hypothetical protein
MGQWPIWLQIVHLARQMAIFLCSESPQTLDFQGLAGFLRWQSGRQISGLKHASHQLPRALQICLLYVGVHVAHGRDIRPPADDLHRVNPAVVNLLLTNATFINVLNRLTLYFDEVFAAGFAMHNQQIEKLSNLVMGLGTPAAEQTAQTVDLMKEPIYQADETTLQNEFLTAIRQIKAKVGEDRAAQTALFTDETMEQIEQQLDKGQHELHNSIIYIYA